MPRDKNKEKDVLRNRENIDNDKDCIRNKLKKNKIAIIIVIIVTIVLLFFLTNYIRLNSYEKNSVIISARNNYKNYVYDDKKYFENELKPGIYKAFAIKEYGYVQVENNKEINEASPFGIVNNTIFDMQGYVEIEKGDTVSLEDCYIIPVDKAVPTEEMINNIAKGDNTYLVGKDIKAGDYEIVPMKGNERNEKESLIGKIVSKKIKEKLNEKNKSKVCEVLIWNNLRNTEPVFYKSNFKKIQIKLKEGQFIELEGCKAIFIK